jgi:hypothetical protein
MPKDEEGTGGLSPGDFIPANPEEATLEDWENALEQARYLKSIDPENQQEEYEKLLRITKEQKRMQKRQLPEVARNMGGTVHNTYSELGYNVGGVHKEKPQKPIKYSKGGAVRGMKFGGIY